jgi:hypothetical protein
VRADALLRAFYQWCADADIPEVTTLAETIETWWLTIQIFLITGLRTPAPRVQTG